MHAHTYTYKCMHTHTHTYRYKCMHTHTHINACTHTHTHINACIHTHTHINACIHTHTLTYKCMHSHTHTHINACIHTHTHTHIHINACIHTHTHKFMHTHIHTHTYILTHKCMHAHTHTAVCHMGIEHHMNECMKRRMSDWCIMGCPDRVSCDQRGAVWVSHYHSWIRHVTSRTRVQSPADGQKSRRSAARVDPITEHKTEQLLLQRQYLNSALIHSIHLWILKNKYMTVSTKILCSTTVFNIDNNQKCFLSSILLWFLKIMWHWRLQ